MNAQAQIIPFPTRADHDPWVTKRELATELRCSLSWIEHHAELKRAPVSRIIAGRRKYKLNMAKEIAER